MIGVRLSSFYCRRRKRDDVTILHDDAPLSSLQVRDAAEISSGGTGSVLGFWGAIVLIVGTWRGGVHFCALGFEKRRPLIL